MQLIKIFNTFAANAQASSRAVTIPKNAKSTVATAAAKIIKNNLKKGKSAKADDKTISARSVTKPKATAKNTVKTAQARKPAAKVNMAGLPKDYKKIGIFGEAKATQEQAAALIYLNNTDPQLNCSVDELVDLYWTEAGREGVREDIALAQAIIETGFFSFTGDVKPEQLAQPAAVWKANILTSRKSACARIFSICLPILPKSTLQQILLTRVMNWHMPSVWNAA